jgi:tRNA(Ile)-lysidine synthase
MIHSQCSPLHNPAAPVSLESFSLQMKQFNLSSHSKIAICVSGGSDSIALMLLLRDWVQQHSSMRKNLLQSENCDRNPNSSSETAAALPSLVAFSVDHGLRPESAVETEYVRRLALQLGIQHSTLVLREGWSDKLPSGHIQKVARSLRMEALETAAHQHGCDAMAIAHHADDQAETFVIRLARSSGLDGLRGMSSVSRGLYGMPMIRPLLSFSKAELVATCAASQVNYVFDASNYNPVYVRTRVRALLDESVVTIPKEKEKGKEREKGIGMVGMEADKNRGSEDIPLVAGILNLQQLIRETCHRLDEATLKLWKSATSHGHHQRLLPFGAVSLNDSFLQLPVHADVRLRLLKTVLMSVSGRPYPPRSARLLRLSQSLSSATSAEAWTLNGCVIRRDKHGEVLFAREEIEAHRRGKLARGDDFAFASTLSSSSQSDSALCLSRFDGRFLIRLNVGTPWSGLKPDAVGNVQGYGREDFALRYLNKTDLANLEGQLSIPAFVPTPVLLTLPVLCDAKQPSCIYAIPQLRYESALFKQYGWKLESSFDPVHPLLS